MYSYYDSPLGEMVMVSDGEYLTGLYFKGQKYFPNLNKFVLKDDLKVFLRASKWLDEYFKGNNPKIDKGLFKFSGTDFQNLVWNILLDIPYGKTVTYKEIGDKILSFRKQVSYQAVGGAIAHNPILIMIPCHRVLGSDGRLTGYAGGLDKKEYLLNDGFVIFLLKTKRKSSVDTVYI